MPSRHGDVRSTAVTGVLRASVVLLSASFGIAIARSVGSPAPVGALGGALLGTGVVWLEHRAATVGMERLFWGAVGTFFGLIAGLAVGAAVAFFVPAVGTAVIGLAALLGAYLAGATAVRRHAELGGVSALRFPASGQRGPRSKVLDTSAIIDGRLADVCAAGFVDGPLVVPQFVLGELQRLADSGDLQKRNRGKRGFDILRRLQDTPAVRVEITDVDFPDLREVDRKLVALGKALGASLVTTDYNLNEMAKLSGLVVLNVNELANALRPVVLPGEAMPVRLLREGKEAGQAVAYLDDGTMVVVDHGKRFLGQTVEVVVTSARQTAAGRMIFARVRGEEDGSGRG